MVDGTSRLPSKMIRSTRELGLVVDAERPFFRDGTKLRKEL
jgi:hypothetical protein